ncbi:MAG: ABC transporter permease [Lachnospiraceae bacterium]|nr:ABC transporter permease [Lachnospiraceae bacterium]
MLLKYTLNNILQKKGRLFIILFCMAIACCAAFLAADFVNSLQKILETNSGRYVGTTDYLVIYRGSGGVTDELFTGVPIENYVCKRDVTKREITRDEKMYNYALSETVTFSSFTDFDKAHEMDLLPETAIPKQGEVTINNKYSEKYGYKQGDTIILYDSDDNEYPFVISSVFSENNTTKGEYYGYMSKEDSEMVTKSEVYYYAYVDIGDNENREVFEKTMEEKHPNATLNKLFFTENFQKLFDQLTSIFYLVFVMLFLLVLFVTVSFTEKIINERMSVIGTLRSIGVSMRKTAFILLFENVMYALIGSFIGFIIYLIGSRISMNIIFGDENAANLGKISPLTVVMVVLGAIMVQLLIPSVEMLKAVKTSIRDIIFETRDSEYRLSYPRTILGGVFIILGLVLGFSVDDLTIVMISIILTVAGVAMFLPIILRKLSVLFSDLFEKLKMPVAELASTEAGSKKHNFGSATLAVASILVTSVIFVTGQSLLSIFERPVYNSDIVVTGTTLKTSKYDFVDEIEDVDRVDFRYLEDSTFNDIGYGDNEKTGITVMALTDMDTYKGMGDLPKTLEGNEVVINQSAARKLNVSKGSRIKVTFHISNIFPMEREIVIKEITDTSEFMSAPTFIITPEMYKEIYTDQPTEMFIHTSKPDEVKKEVENEMTYGEIVKTNDEIIKENEKNNRSLVYVLSGVIIVSVILSLVGISGNQVISFASRKKEYAMLHSCASPLKQIISLIWIENAFVFAISGILAFIMCFPITMLASKAFELADTGVSLNVRFSTLILYIMVLWLITMMTAITPVKSLKKMNTATELKYE